MSAIEIILWPAVGFLIVAALASLWQARGAHSPQQRDSRQSDTSFLARPGLSRSLVFGGLALAILAFLLTRS